ncbi:unnamed protein product [Fusarium graminearum]|uniref:Nuclear pore complex component n=1 Tax=Gibberella zeae TaxID=5518 RepID=A0A9N8RHH8_GIBZA|nr:unnamed protein product [Fusarium graminearum]
MAGESLSLISLVATSTILITKGATELTTASARSTHILTNRDTIVGGYIAIFQSERKVKATLAHILQNIQELHGIRQATHKEPYQTLLANLFVLCPLQTLEMATPVRTATIAGPSVTDSPGTWRHPRLNEITRRRNATTFSEKNVRQIAYNVIALLGFWSAQLLAKLNIGSQALPSTFRVYLGWAWFILQLIPFVNIGVACLPLIRPKDDLSDIPLTSAQRQLLGLDPSSAAPTPDAKFSTPPRYSRTPSLGGSVGSRGSYNSSPLSSRGSPFVQGSPLGSPLFQKSTNSFGSSFGNSFNGRRSSFGSTSPFAASSSSNVFSNPTSPGTPGGKRTSVGLNSKWLYEKGRRPSGSAWGK